MRRKADCVVARGKSNASWIYRRNNIKIELTSKRSPVHEVSTEVRFVYECICGGMGGKM